MKKTILVTGGAGYIGSHTAYQLVQQGYHVVIIDLFLHQQQISLSWATVVRSDFSDREALEAIFSRYDVEAVMHFAAFIEVGESVVEPQRFYHNNVIKTEQLLEVMAKFSVNKFIFSSSCAVYGVPQYLPLDEHHPTNPVSPYGLFKLMVEYALYDYAKIHGIQSIALRYFNAAGATPSLGLGEQHQPETHLIPLLLQSILYRQPMTVFGNDYDTDDGTCVRDYVHVQDIAQAHCKALMYLNAHPDVGARVINLGTGKGYSVKQVITMASKICKQVAPVTYAARRPGDCPVLVANATLAHELLAWKPQHGELEEMISSAWEWVHVKSRTLEERYHVHE